MCSVLIEPSLICESATCFSFFKSEIHGQSTVRIGGIASLTARV